MTSQTLIISFAAVIATSLYFVPSTDALKCYVCNTKFNSSCQSNPSQQYLQDCENMRYKMPQEFRSNNTPFTVCRIMTISASGEPTHVDRRCGWLKSHKECVNTATFQIKSTTCECQGDGCNSAPMGAASLSVAALSAIFALVYGNLRC